MYTSIIVAATTALIGSVSAVPLRHVARSASNVTTTSTETVNYPYWNTSHLSPGPMATGTASIPLSTSTPQQPSQPAPAPYAGAAIATILPDYTSQYTSSTGAIDFHTPRGYVSRSPYNHGADKSTLVTFQLPAQYAANQCQVVFDLTEASAALSGTGKVQIFTSLAPATASSASWPSGNLRDQNLGAMTLVKGGRGLWEAGSGPGATTNGVFPCKDIAGKIYGGEIVPVGDVDEISWAAGMDGVKIVVY
jgi:hypothetical protein